MALWSPREWSPGSSSGWPSSSSVPRSWDGTIEIAFTFFQQTEESHFALSSLLNSKTVYCCHLSLVRAGFLFSLSLSLSLSSSFCKAGCRHRLDFVVCSKTRNLSRRRLQSALCTLQLLSRSLSLPHISSNLSDLSSIPPRLPAGLGTLKRRVGAPVCPDLDVVVQMSAPLSV